MAWDFPAAPTEEQKYTPAGGPTYVYRSPAWRVDSAAGGGGGSSKVTISDDPPASPTAGDQWLKGNSGELFAWFDDGSSAQWVQTNGAMLAGPTPGIVKISEGGATGSIVQLDVTLPPGYKGYELMLNDINVATAGSFILSRFSLDNGATYPATAVYIWGLDVINNNASGGWGMEGSTAAMSTYMRLTSATALGGPSNVGGHLRFRIPRAGAGTVQLMLFEGQFWSGSGVNYYMVRGHGRYLGANGPATRIRIVPNTGNLLIDGGWQLNGWL